MFWLAATAFLFMEGTALLRRRNLRRLVPSGLAGLLLTGIHIGLPEPWMFVRLQDSGPISGDTALTLLIQSIGGPVAAMWFAQGLGPHFPGAVLRVFQFSLISLTFWWMAVEAGRAIWWGPVQMLLICLVWYSLVYCVHTYSLVRVRRSAPIGRDWLDR